MKAINMAGRRYGTLVVQDEYKSLIRRSGGKTRYWTCKCDCGRKRHVITADLTNGRVKSCGCGGSTRTDGISITYKGETAPLRQWATRVGIKYQTLYGRLARGWSIEKAFETPVANGHHVLMRWSAEKREITF
jgi:hypothetical protein